MLDGGSRNSHEIKTLYRCMDARRREAETKKILGEMMVVRGRMGRADNVGSWRGGWEWSGYL